MDYKEYQKKERELANKLPLKFAFSEKQFNEMMNEWGFNENEVDKIYKFGNSGGFYRKEDAQKLKNCLNKIEQLKVDFEKEMDKNRDIRIEAFLYEMNNHEYAINYYQGDWDVCNCFADKELPFLDESEDEPYKAYLKIIGHENWIPEYELAMKKHYKIARENEWF